MVQKSKNLRRIYEKKGLDCNLRGGEKNEQIIVLNYWKQKRKESDDRQDEKNDEGNKTEK